MKLYLLNRLIYKTKLLRNVILRFSVFCFILSCSFLSFADDNTGRLQNWIEINDSRGEMSRVSNALFKFDPEGDSYTLNARLNDMSPESVDLDVDSISSSIINSEPDDCDYTGGWVGTTDQGKELIFIIANRVDIIRIQIAMDFDTPFCSKSFGSGFSGAVGNIKNNKFRISDVVVCGTRLTINGEISSCDNADGKWNFHCPGCGSVSGTWNAKLDVAPPVDISNFTATPGDAKVSLSWVNPPDLDLKGVRIQRSQSSIPISPNEGETVFAGFSSNFEDKCVSNGKKYFYTAFTFDKVSNFSSGISTETFLN